MTKTRYEILSECHGRLERKHRPLGSDFIDIRLDRIAAELEFHNETMAEAGRYGAFCPFTRERLGDCLDRVEQLIAEIEDQLADWDNA